MKKIFSVIILGGFLGSVVALLSSAPLTKSTSERKPSSQGLIGKQQRLFDIKIKALRGLPKDPTQEVALQAKVTLLQDIHNVEVHYRWVLPEPVKILDGQQNDSVVGLQSAQSFVRNITVDGLTTEGEPQVLVLQVYAEVGGVNIGSAGVFSTKPSEVEFSDPTPTPNPAPTAEAQTVTPPTEPALPRSIQQ